MLLSACNTMPEAAVASWQTVPGDLPPDPRWQALSWAMLAPSPHNLQPWLADLREPDRIRLRVDRQRLLPQTDPFQRQILIGCGAFLELLQMAAGHAGWHTDIELLPQGSYGPDAVDDRPFADVWFTRDAGVAADPLFASVRQRRTNRRPYAEHQPAEADLARLAQAAERPGIRLGMTTEPARVQAIAALAAEGCRLEFSDAALWAESVATLRVGTDAVAVEPSGTPVLGVTAWWADRLGLLDDAALRRVDGLAVRRAVQGCADASVSTPAWIWLTSDSNTRQAQIDSGRAYLRVDLMAAATGLAIQPNSQVLQEVELLRPLYERFHAEVGVKAPGRVQMLARIGHAERPDPSPRRNVAQIIQR